MMTARNGQEALDVLENKRPALIITDILMPRMDSFTLVYRLCKDQKTRDIPFVSPEDKAFAAPIGATEFIEKSIDTKTLLRTMDELLKPPPTVAPMPLKEREFFKEYQNRLETKSEQKNTQKARAERLLETVPLNEKPGF